MTREYFPGVGQAVADRTINRPGETWADVAKRVAAGNAALDPDCNDRAYFERAIADGRILMSGRHLQHGDETQPGRNIEVFSNCSTAAQRSLVFYLLLNGSGVGTSYDDDMCPVDWEYMPEVAPVLSRDHADAADGDFETFSEANERAKDLRKQVVSFRVPDSREGWAEAVALVEELTYGGNHRNSMLILDFSDVRPRNSPIMGMQGRPSSGPIPLMRALRSLNTIKGRRMPPWEQAMHIDHLLAEPVMVGGARRAARIAVKWWGDEDIFAFINIKQGGVLWSANNSVGVDKTFWEMVWFVDKYGYAPTAHHQLAYDVFEACINAQYLHGTGEPGFLNLDLLSRGETAATAEESLNLNGRFQLRGGALELRKDLITRSAKKKYPVITNPCGEIRLNANGGYCVIADIAAAHCEDTDELVEAARLATRALIRTNLMPALYQGEVNRTNRIGIGLTGLHEYAWTTCGLSFRDLIEEGEETMLDGNGVPMKAPSERAYPFWESLRFAAVAVTIEAERYCAELGVNVPTTLRTIKPAGTTSKLFGLTEGVHLPAMREYLRWVQFRSDSPLVAEYEDAGYPVRRDLKSYKDVVIVGFPTRLPIREMMGDAMVTAAEATPEEQIRWLRLLETFWLLEEGGNQISYTLKYDPKVVDLDDYRAFMLENVPLVRAVSIMPQIDTTAYEYQPEEPITVEEYERLVRRINHGSIDEDVGLEHVGCSTGACPINFEEALK